MLERKCLWKRNMNIMELPHVLALITPRLFFHASIVHLIIPPELSFYPKPSHNYKHQSAEPNSSIVSVQTTSILTMYHRVCYLFRLISQIPQKAVAFNKILLWILICVMRSIWYQFGVHKCLESLTESRKLNFCSTLFNEYQYYIIWLFWNHCYLNGEVERG